MSSERDKPCDPDPHGAVSSFTYDSCGRTGTVYDVLGRPIQQGLEPVAAAWPPEAGKPAVERPAAGAPYLRHCFAFRLCGSEARGQTLPVEGGGGGTLIVAIEHVRAYLTGAAPAAAPASAIGGIEVHAALDASQVLCTAQRTDFQAGDLVVVEVDIAVYSCGGGP